MHHQLGRSVAVHLVEAAERCQWEGYHMIRGHHWGYPMSVHCRMLILGQTMASMIYGGVGEGRRRSHQVSMSSNVGESDGIPSEGHVRRRSRRRRSRSSSRSQSQQSKARDLRSSFAFSPGSVLSVPGAGETDDDWGGTSVSEVLMRDTGLEVPAAAQ